MTMQEKYEYKLTGSSIDEISEKTDNYLQNLKMENKNRIRVRLSIEEMLLEWRDHFGEETVCKMAFIKKFGRPCLLLEIEGNEFDPTSSGNNEEETGKWGGRLLGSMGLYPMYSYSKGKNQVLLRLKKPKKNPLFALLCSFSLAIITGLLGSVLPGSLVTALLDNLIEPVYETFLGILNTIAGPMVFVAVAWGIYGIGDITALGRIGKRMLLRYFGMSILIVSFTALIWTLWFRVSLASDVSAAGSQLWSIFNMLLDIFPENMVQPFLEGNSMQIILSAVFVGSALLVLGKQTEAVSSLVEQLNYVVNFLVELITNLVPYFIFVVVVQMFWTDSLSVVSEAWAAILLFLVAILIILIFLFLRVAAKNQVSPFLLVRKCTETFVVAFTTASSTATFGTAMHCCEKKLGIGNYLSNFGLPLGLVFYAPATAAYFLITSFYVAGCYDVKISFAWILMAVIVSVVLAVASPPIPGGTLVCYTVMFSQLGIPEEGLVAAMAMDVIFDFVATAVNMVLLELELTSQAYKLKLLNKELLCKNNH